MESWGGGGGGEAVLNYSEREGGGVGAIAEVRI